MLNYGALYFAVTFTCSLICKNKNVSGCISCQDTHATNFFWSNMFTFPLLNISPSPCQWLAKMSRDMWATFSCIYLNNAKGLLTCQECQSKTLKVQMTQGPSLEARTLTSHFRPHCPISHRQQETRH